MAYHYATDPGHFGRYDTNGSRIRELRKVKGWTQADLASRAECSESTISNLEKGKRGLAFTLGKLAEAFDLKSYRDLVVLPPGDTSSATQNAATSKKTSVVAGKPLAGLIIDDDIHEFDETDQLERLMAALAKGLNLSVKSIYVIKIIPGSIIIRMLISHTGLRRLFESFVAGDLNLSPFRVIGIDVPQLLPLKVVDLLKINQRLNFDLVSPGLVRITVPALVVSR
jgi:transcriptional regulator with XRE-family HTH domain